jgi:fructokinase
VLSVLGELVADLLPVSGVGAGPEGTAPQFVARPGGNALNVAVAAGRLGARVELRARLGSGPLAVHLRRHAELSGVDVSGFVEATEPVSLAVVGLDDHGSADYGFHVIGAADWQWTDEELAALTPDRTAILHIGSISSWTVPGSEAIARLEPAAAATAEALDDAAQRWADRGPALVLLTDGGQPLRVARPGRPLLRREPPRVTVADTVGAGDTLAAGLLTGLLSAGVTARTALESLADHELAALVDDAALAAALTCTRVGADPPTRADLVAGRARR